MSRKVILTILVVSLFVFSIPQISINKTAGSVQTDDSNESTNVQSELTSIFDPAGPPRPVVDYGLGTRTGQTVSLPGSPNGYVDLDSDWIGNAAEVRVYNLSDKRDWVVNGTFNKGSGGSSPPWAYYEYDYNGNNGGQWTSSQPQAGKNCTYISWPTYPKDELIGSTYYHHFQDGEWSAWNATFYVPRGTVISARLKFVYYPDLLSSFDRDEFKIYAKTERGIVWQKGFHSIIDDGLNRKWTSMDLDVMTDVDGYSVFSLPTDQNILVTLGMRYASGTAHYAWPDYDNRVYFDNVTLILETSAKPYQIDLKVRPQGGSNATVSSTVQWGEGTAVLTGFAASGMNFPFIFAGGNLTTNTAGLSCTIRVNATKQNTATSTFESHGSGQKVTWSFFYRTSLYTASQTIGSTVYTKYYFNISVPSNWNYTTCKDPDGVNHNIASEPNNFKVSVVGPNKVLTVNVSRINSYSRSPLFNPYQINGESYNYVKTVFTQKYVSGNWVNSTIFKPNDYMKVVGLIQSPTGTRASTGTANMSSCYGTPATTWKPLNQTTPVNGLANFTFNIGNWRAFASNYTAEIAWLNSTLGEPQAGAGTVAFKVVRDLSVGSSGTAHSPSDDDIIAQDKTFSVSVVLIDALNGTIVSDAKPNFRINWTGSWPITLLWNSLGNNYTADTTVPKSAHGLYWINVTLTGDYYSNSTHIIPIYVIFATLASCNPSFRSIEWGEKWFNFSITYFKAYPIQQPITGANITCLTSFWISRFVYQSSSTPGFYDISLRTEGVNESEGTIEFFVWSPTVSDYELKRVSLLLGIYPIEGSLDSFVPTSSGDVVADSTSITQGGTGVFLIKFFDTHANPITGASLTFTSDIGSGSLAPVNGRPGYYWLNMTTGGVNAGTYSINVTAQKQHYVTKNKIVSLEVRTPGLPIELLVAGSVGSAGAVIGIVAGIWFVRRARIPFIIKKIDETLKLIGKGDHESATPLPLRSREETVVSITQERIAAFSGRKPVVWAPPEAGLTGKTAGEAAVVGPPVEVEKALKRELKAVEPGKPEEEIEEVEMETLDEELGRLEKVDTGQEVPEGAKQARDVIEEYKKRKKK